MRNKHYDQFQREIIEVIPPPTDPLFRWQPVVGEETLALQELLKIPGEEGERVKDEAISVLSKCVPPSASPEQMTGLVVGYVQSGKTMSFTMVTALARDNDYQMVIVIAGTSIPLLDQSTKRLERDLGFDAGRARKWLHLKSRDMKSNDLTKIENVLAEWQDPSVPHAERRTVLITAMKHHGHLKKVYDVLTRIKNLQNVPTLIIDDEADQASLNAKVKQGKASTTYKRILTLKGILPHHTFLQYTATPQAPLLINLIDVLSPCFAEVLTPGQDYVGGKDFFLDFPSLVQTIPTSDIGTDDYPLYAPPESLKHALRLFFLGVAAGIVVGKRADGNRSMMVHPSRKTVGHEENYRWIEKVRKCWLDSYKSPDKQELLEEFGPAYNELQQTVDALPPFEKLVERLYHAIDRTHLEEVNARGQKTPLIGWKHNYSHILVGGQAMDRGFTVEGLTITYMPRNAGVGNADTIQQRARFFGYKRKYLGYCRVFLEGEVHDAFRSYVEHEEDIRERLLDHKKTGKSLGEWKRAFFLDRQLKPTRRNVLDLDYMRGSFAAQWFDPKAPHDSIEAVEANRVVVRDFLDSLSLQSQKLHQVAEEVSLKSAYRQLLVPLRLTRQVDSQRFTGLLLQIEAYLEDNPKATCTIYQMRNGNLRERVIKNDIKDEIPQLFQGPGNKKGKGKKSAYPGDRQIKAPQGVTIQIHNLRVKYNKSGEVIEEVPVVAVWMPKEMSKNWLVQEQGGTR